jgi:DNA-binding response OmpR family regulator
MIAIISSNTRERAAFAALCESNGWPAFECGSVRKLGRLLPQMRPDVIVMRRKLGDGYSEDVFALLEKVGLRDFTRVIVMVEAGTPSAHEARQVELGADVVHRDPIRADVVSSYIARFRTATSRGSQRAVDRRSESLPFAGANVDVVKRTLNHSGKTVGLTNREVELIQFLFEAGGNVVTYDMLYSEILGRRFRGDTSNMRVLLGKLSASFRAVGIGFRPCIEVIPKTGYRYLAVRDS